MAGKEHDMEAMTPEHRKMHEAMLKKMSGISDTLKKGEKTFGKKKK